MLMLLVDLYGTAGAGAASGPAGWASKTRVQKVRSGSSGRGYRWNISGIRVSFKKLVARNQVSEETRVRRTGGARGRACTWVGTSNQLPPNMAAKAVPSFAAGADATAAAAACVLVIVGAAAAAAAAVSAVVTKGCSAGQSLAAGVAGTAVGREGYTYTVDEHHVGCRVGAAALPCAA